MTGGTEWGIVGRVGGGGLGMGVFLILVLRFESYSDLILV